MSEKRVNYTEAQEAYLRETYAELGTPEMARIVELFNTKFGTEKSIKSVRGKVMTFQNAEGDSVYVPIVKPEKVAVEKGPTKSDLLVTLAETVGDSFVTTGLENATKPAIERLITAFSA